MNLKEFGSWSPYKQDNLKYVGDEYNRSFIKERFECPKEYECSDFEEYYRVPGMNELGKWQESKKNDSAKKAKNKRQLRQNMLRQVVCLAAGSVVITTSYQSVMKQQQQLPVSTPVSVVQTDDTKPGDKQDILPEQIPDVPVEQEPEIPAEQEPPKPVEQEQNTPAAHENTPAAQESDSAKQEPISSAEEGKTAPAEQKPAATKQEQNTPAAQESDSAKQEPTSSAEEGQTATEPKEVSASWKWSPDHQTATLELLDSNGDVIKTVSASVQVTEKAATCNKEGLKTYTATAEEEGTSYSDSQTEALSPLGHAFDDGEEVTLEGGKTARTFTCTRCHEQFTVATSMTEND